MKSIRKTVLGFTSLVIVLCLILSLMPSKGFADGETDTEEKKLNAANFVDWPWLTGDWGGGRTWLREKAGIDVIVNYEIDFAGNPVGGEIHSGMQASNFFAGLNFNWGAWTKALKGFELQVSMIYRFGSSLSQEAIGNKFSVQQVYGGNGVILYDLWIRWTSRDGRYSLKFGRIAQGDDFLKDPIYDFYENNAFDGNPVSIFYNSPMMAYPFATWGVMLMLNPVDEWYAKVGVYGADTRLSDNSYHGAFFGFDFNEGAYVIAQTGYRLNHGFADMGLKGEYNIGGYYNSGSRAVYNRAPGATVTGISGGYISFDQYLHYFGKDRSRGINLWGSAIIGPESTSLMPYFLSGGLVFKGMTRKRSADAIVLGAAWGKFSPALAQQERKAGQLPQNYELLFELAYWIQATGFLFISPGVQVVVNPGGGGGIPTALVLGFQAGVNL